MSMTIFVFPGPDHISLIYQEEGEEDFTHKYISSREGLKIVEWRTLEIRKESAQKWGKKTLTVL